MMGYDDIPFEESEDLGKIEDAGIVVQGGGIDRYWDRDQIELNTKLYVGESKLRNEKWLHDSNEALDHFRLRSIEFGNWMSQEDRANFLYASMLGLHQLAKIFGIPDKYIGFGQKLSIALGARGKGGQAAAHYESTPNAVINITKTQGMGSLAHEYGHAIDNILSFYTKSKQTFVSGGRTTRQGHDENIAKNGNFYEKEFEELFNRLYFEKDGKDTDFNKNLNGKGDYLNRRNEVFARTFEVYISNLQKSKSLTNDFLAPTEFDKVYPSKKLVGRVAPIIKKIITSGFKLMAEKAPTQSLNGVESIMSGVDGFRKTLVRNGNLEDTIKHIKRIALRDIPVVRELALNLQGESVGETAQNIWEFIRENLTYELDTEGIEELRTPARTLHDKTFDCDDATILTSAILSNLDIVHEYRITAYEEVGKFGHIYPVAIDENGEDWVIDAVPEIPYFNYEEHPIIDQITVKINPMDIQELSGIEDDMLEQELFEEEMLNGDFSEEEISDEEIEQDLIEEMNQPFSLSGMDEEDEEDEDMFDGSFLSGLGEVDSEDEADIIIQSKDDAIRLLENGILAEVVKAQKSLINEKRNPTALSQIVKVDNEIALLNEVIESWEDQEERDNALLMAVGQNTSYKNFYRSMIMSLEELENSTEELSGIDDEEEPIFLAKIDSDLSIEDLLEANEDEEEDEDLDGIFRRKGRGKKKRKGLFRRLSKGAKKVFRKVGKVAKKAVKAVVRFNPATIAVRAAILLVLKTNLFKMSSQLIYGYLTQSQAQAKNVDLNEWRKLVNAKNKAERFFKKLGGKGSAFRRAITKGRAAKKTGLRLNGLGAAAAVGGTAAASGFIAFAKRLLSKVNPARLFKKVAAKVKAKQATKATTGIPPSRNIQPARRGSQVPSASPFDDNTIDPSNNGGDNNMGMMDKLKGFLTQHKKTVIIGSLGTTIVIIGVIVWNSQKKKKKNQLRGMKAARTRARNRKQLQGLLGSTSTPKRRATKAIGSAKKKAPVLNGKSRFSQMHAKAKQLQKKHPKTKYSKLLSMASKQIK